MWSRTLVSRVTTGDHRLFDRRFTTSQICFYNEDHLRYITHAWTIIITFLFKFLVVYRTTKLTNEEISQISHKVGLEWEGIAGLMDIPYAEREEIRVNFGKYPKFSSKAKRLFELVNDSKCFDRHNLIKYFEELGRYDLRNEMLSVTDEVFHDLEFSLPLDSTFSAFRFYVSHKIAKELQVCGYHPRGRFIISA